MSVYTQNGYGQITITNEAIAEVAALAALECYGIVDLVSRRVSDSVKDLIKKKRASRGIKVSTERGRIIIDLYIIIKYGVSIDAVAESLKKSVKYSVEKFTGMLVDTINVEVVGVKI